MIEVGTELVEERRSTYGKYTNWYPVVNEVVGSYACLWDWCYGDGTLTEGEFAKLMDVELSIAWQRIHELYPDIKRIRFEQTVHRRLLGEYGACDMADDFAFRPWRFAA